VFFSRILLLAALNYTNLQRKDGTLRFLLLLKLLGNENHKHNHNNKQNRNNRNKCTSNDFNGGWTGVGVSVSVGVDHVRCSLSLQVITHCGEYSRSHKESESIGLVLWGSVEIIEKHVPRNSKRVSNTFGFTFTAQNIKVPSHHLVKLVVKSRVTDVLWSGQKCIYQSGACGSSSKGCNRMFESRQICVAIEENVVQVINLVLVLLLALVLPSFGQIGGDYQFVTQLYNILLNRNADMPGLQNAVAALSRGTTRADLINSVLASPEYLGNPALQDKFDQVMRGYRVILGREGEAEGVANALTVPWDVLFNSFYTSPEYQASALRLFMRPAFLATSDDLEAQAETDVVNTNTNANANTSPSTIAIIGCVLIAVVAVLLVVVVVLIVLISKKFKLQEEKA